MGLTKPTEPPRKGVFDWDEVAAELQQYPGQHRSLGRVTQGTYIAARYGRIKAVRPALGFQWFSRHNDTETKTCELIGVFDPDNVDPILAVAQKRRAAVRRNRKEG